MIRPLILASFIFICACSSAVKQTTLSQFNDDIATADTFKTRGSDGEPSLVKKNNLPAWVLLGSKYYGFEVGVSCEEFSASSGYSALIKAKSMAKDKARLALFGVNGGMQKIHAIERFESNNNEKEYSVVISTLSSGRFWRNEVVDEIVLEDGITTQYCVSIKFVS